jgi:hypothetical protein
MHALIKFYIRHTGKTVEEDSMFNKNFELLPINLRLFDGEAGGGSAAGVQTGGEGQGATAGASSTVGGQQSKASEKPVVVYGKQDTTTGDKGSGTQDPKPGGEKAPTPEERQAAFAKIKTDYKDLYDTEVQSIIKNRLSKFKGLEAQHAQMSQVVDLLAGIYGTTDVNTLLQKIQGDTIKDLAEREGMTVEQYKKVLALQQENKLLQSKTQNDEAIAATNEKVSKWWGEVDKLTGTKEAPGLYPGLNFKELVSETNPKSSEFLSTLEALTTAGFQNPVQRAYEVTHMDEIKNAAAASAAKVAENNTIQNIQSRGARPPENGTKSTPGMIVKSDPSNITREDRAEIARRASRGEEIKF